MEESTIGRDLRQFFSSRDRLLAEQCVIHGYRSADGYKPAYEEAAR
jgi:hypothetical protein